MSMDTETLIYNFSEYLQLVDVAYLGGYVRDWFTDPVLTHAMANGLRDAMRRVFLRELVVGARVVIDGMHAVITLREAFAIGWMYQDGSAYQMDIDELLMFGRIQLP